MILKAYPRLMTRYNRWQNTSLYGAADGLTDAGRHLDRGAFFGSIHATLAHILWADRMWLSRFGQCEKLAGKGSEAGSLYPDWDGLKAAREDVDALMLTWADGLDDTALQANLTWYSGILQADQSRPVWFVMTHMFNHQTHHRGQVHAMLTAAGAKPDDTDIFLMDTQT